MAGNSGTKNNDRRQNQSQAAVKAPSIMLKNITIIPELMNPLEENNISINRYETKFLNNEQTKINASDAKVYKTITGDLHENKAQ